MLRGSGLVYLVALIVLTGCSSDSTQPPEEAGVKEVINLEGSTDVIVTTDLTITWSGPKARYLSIKDVGHVPPLPSWQIDAEDDSQGFASPVQYGQMPPGGKCRINSINCLEPLEIKPGRMYHILVQRVNNTISLRYFQTK